MPVEVPICIRTAAAHDRRLIHRQITIIVNQVAALIAIGVNRRIDIRTIPTHRSPTYRNGTIEGRNGLIPVAICIPVEPNRKRSDSIVAKPVSVLIDVVANFDRTR